MMIKRNPQYGKDFGPGWAMFTQRRTPVSWGIAQATASAEYDAGLVVATHCGLVTGPNAVGEALGSGFQISQLQPLLDDRDVAVWFRRPRGLTAPAVAAMVGQATAWAFENVSYDLIGCATEPWALDLDDPDALFCSEGDVKLLLIAEPHLDQPLPEALHRIPPEKWNPHELDQLVDFWEDAVGENGF